jgi:hypothetical protein
MTSIQENATAVTPPETRSALRGNCMGAAVLLIVQFAVGMGVNLYVTLPKHKSFLPTVFGSALLAAHVIVALLLLGAAVGAFVRAIRARAAIAFTALGLAAILSAGIAGATFVGSAANAASLVMALATAVAMFSYLAAVFTLRPV